MRQIPAGEIQFSILAFKELVNQTALIRTNTTCGQISNNNGGTISPDLSKIAENLNYQIQKPRMVENVIENSFPYYWLNGFCSLEGAVYAIITIYVAREENTVSPPVDGHMDTTCVEIIICNARLVKTLNIRVVSRGLEGRIEESLEEGRHEERSSEHLAHLKLLLTCGVAVPSIPSICMVQCICLAQLRSDAVDSPKTGTPPEFPPVLRAKESKTNLNVENFDQRLYADAYEEFLYGARKLKREYDANIRGLMNQFGIITEIEEPRDVKKSVMEALIPIKRHYRKLFEQEFFIEGSSVVLPGVRSRMESKAYAWYYVSYHPSELDDDSENMISFPWVAHDVTLPVEKIVKLKVSKSFHA
ncbi:unnamed protein product [Rhizophagus irregularis]|nr:unnamed protein product [Rhizophagus irregularis]